MKRRNTVIAKPAVKEGPTIRILRRAQCPSLSGKSKLVYEVGLTDTQELQLRVVSNSNSGAWSQEWVKLQAVEAAFDRVAKGEPVTADALAPMFRGTSQNTPYFVLAALKHAGFVVPSQTKKRCYDRVEPTAFREEIQALIEERAVPDAKEKKGRGKKAAPAENLSASTKSKKRPA